MCRSADVPTSRKEKVTLLAQDIANRTDAILAGVIGHIAILYKEQPEEGKRRIKVKGDG